MPAIIEFPTLVQHAVEQFGTVFANEPERRHFAEYLTGLLVAEQKTVSGINAEFAQTTDQIGFHAASEARSSILGRASAWRLS